MERVKKAYNIKTVTKLFFSAERSHCLNVTFFVQLLCY